MKKFFVLSSISLSVGLGLWAFRPAESGFAEAIPVNESGDELRFIKNESFKRGEKLTFRLHYGLIEAGHATIEIKPEARIIAGRPTYHMVGEGRSKGTFDWFFKVRDRYETYVDEQALVPWVFIRRVQEGGFKLEEDYVFNHYKNKVSVSKGNTYPVPDNVQDMVSAFYFARSIDFSTAKPGDIFTIPSFVDKETWPLKIKYVGKENLKTDLGTFRTLKFRPVVQRGRIFKAEEDLNVWITDDKNRIPLRAEAKVLVGSIKMDLLEYAGLANPLPIVK